MIDRTENAKYQSVIFIWNPSREKNGRSAHWKCEEFLH